MKKYVIENQLIYNAEDRSLTRVGDELADVVLTHIAGRLLTLLLESRGETLLRDTILQRVWDDYGLASSNNNLNHYISNTRKQLSALGLEKTFIITEPKRGFRLNTDVAIEEQAIAIAGEAHDQTDGSLPIRQAEKKPRLISLRTLGVLVFVGAVTAVIGYCSTLEDGTTHPHIQGIQYVLNEHGCPIYTTKRNLSPEHAQYDHIILGNILEKSHISCTNNDIIIAYFSGVFEDNKYDGQAFVAKCTLKSSTILSCQNRYIYSVKNNET